MQEVDASRAIVKFAESSGLSVEVAGAISQRLSGDDNLLFLEMLGAGALLVVVLSLYLLIFTHKVAGPLYKVGVYLKEMQNGRLGKIYSLRRGDMLQDFYDQFYNCHTEVRGRFQEDNESLARILGRVKSLAPDLGAISDAERHLEHRNASLAE